MKGMACHKCGTIFEYQRSNRRYCDECNKELQRERDKITRYDTRKDIYNFRKNTKNFNFVFDELPILKLTEIMRDYTKRIIDPKNLIERPKRWKCFACFPKLELRDFDEDFLKHRKKFIYENNQSKWDTILKLYQNNNGFVLKPEVSLTDAGDDKFLRARRIYNNECVTCDAICIYTSKWYYLDEYTKYMIMDTNFTEFRDGWSRGTPYNTLLLLWVEKEYDERVDLIDTFEKLFKFKKVGKYEILYGRDAYLYRDMLVSEER